MTPRSNCHGRPRRRWQTVIGTTSHSKVSSYAPILKETWTVFSTHIVLESLSHWTLYGCGCFIFTNCSLEHSSSLAKLWQLPPSMMTLTDLPLMPGLVWNMWHLWSSSCWCWRLKTLDTTRAGLESSSQKTWSSSCWKYALEAIIKALLLYFLVHDNCLYSCYNCVIRKS